MRWLGRLGPERNRGKRVHGVQADQSAPAAQAAQDRPLAGNPQTPGVSEGYGRFLAARINGLRLYQALQLKDDAGHPVPKAGEPAQTVPAQTASEAQAVVAGSVLSEGAAEREDQNGQDEKGKERHDEEQKRREDRDKRLNLLEVHNIWGMVNSVEVKASKKKLLFLSNEQLRCFDFQNLGKLFAAMDIPTPKLVIQLFGSLACTKKSARFITNSHPSKQQKAFHSHSETSYSICCDVERKLGSILKDSVLPVAVQTNALVIVAADDCMLASAFCAECELYARTVGGRLPFTVMMFGCAHWFYCSSRMPGTVAHKLADSCKAWGRHNESLDNIVKSGRSIDEVSPEWSRMGWSDCPLGCTHFLIADALEGKDETDQVTNYTELNKFRNSFVQHLSMKEGLPSFAVASLAGSLDSMADYIAREMPVLVLDSRPPRPYWTRAGRQTEKGLSEAQQLKARKEELETIRAGLQREWRDLRNSGTWEEYDRSLLAYLNGWLPQESPGQGQDARLLRDKIGQEDKPPGTGAVHPSPDLEAGVGSQRTRGPETALERLLEQQVEGAVEVFEEMAIYRDALKREWLFQQLWDLLEALRRTNSVADLNRWLEQVSVDWGVTFGGMFGLFTGGKHPVECLKAIHKGLHLLKAMQGKGEDMHCMFKVLRLVGDDAQEWEHLKVLLSAKVEEWMVDLAGEVESLTDGLHGVLRNEAPRVGDDTTGTESALPDQAEIPDPEEGSGRDNSSDLLSVMVEVRDQHGLVVSSSPRRPTLPKQVHILEATLPGGPKHVSHVVISSGCLALPADIDVTFEDVAGTQLGSRPLAVPKVAAFRRVVAPAGVGKVQKVWVKLRCDAVVRESLVVDIYPRVVADAPLNINRLYAAGFALSSPKQINRVEISNQSSQWPLTLDVIYKDETGRQLAMQRLPSMPLVAAQRSVTPPPRLGSVHKVELRADDFAAIQSLKVDIYQLGGPDQPVRTTAYLPRSAEFSLYRPEQISHMVISTDCWRLPVTIHVIYRDETGAQLGLTQLLPPLPQVSLRSVTVPAGLGKVSTVELHCDELDDPNLLQSLTVAIYPRWTERLFTFTYVSMLKTLLKSPVLFSANIWEDDVHESIDDLMRVNRLPLENSPEALHIIRQAWDTVDVFSRYSWRCKVLAKLSYTLLILLGTAITLLVVTSLNKPDALRQEILKNVVLALSLGASAVASVTSLYDPVRRWTTLRSAALAMESEVWKFRTRSGQSYSIGIKGSNSRLAEEMLRASIEEIKQHAVKAAGVSATSLSAHFAFFGKPHKGSVYRHGQYKDASTQGTSGTAVVVPPDDDHQSPLTPQHYLRLRVEPMVRFYQGRLPRYNHLYRFVELFLIAGSVAATVVSTVGYVHWTALITAVTGAATAWSSFHDTEKKRGRYSNTLEAVNSVLLWWNQLPRFEKCNTAQINLLVITCEDLFMREREAWVSTSMQTMLNLLQETDAANAAPPPSSGRPPGREEGSSTEGASAFSRVNGRHPGVGRT